MRERAKRRSVPIILLTLLLALGAALQAGCGGGGTGGYTEAVLREWSVLERDGGELVEAASEIADETDLEDLLELLSGSREVVGSFEEEIDGLKVPSGLEESHEALGGFLSAYDDYLKALQKNLDAVLAGEELGYTPDLDTPALEAEEKLEEYQDSQDYNPARLDRDVWDLPAVLGEAIVTIYGGSDLESGQYDKALETLDAWYYYFNRGDGESMYALLDMQSPIKDAFGYESFLVQAGEANASGLRAEYAIDGGDGNTDQEGDWLTVYLTVDYSEYLDMEGNTVPAHMEYVVIDLLNREDGWFVYQVFSESTLW